MREIADSFTVGKASKSTVIEILVDLLKQQFKGSNRKIVRINNTVSKELKPFLHGKHFSTMNRNMSINLVSNEVLIIFLRMYDNTNRGQ